MKLEVMLPFRINDISSLRPVVTYEGREVGTVEEVMDDGVGMILLLNVEDEKLGMAIVKEQMQHFSADVEKPE